MSQHDIAINWVESLHLITLPNKTVLQNHCHLGNTYLVTYMFNYVTRTFWINNHTSVGAKDFKVGVKCAV